MSGKGGGFWDDFLDKPFGGAFDFDGDGKEDILEQWLGFRALEDVLTEAARDSIDPEDFDTREEYEEALEEAGLPVEDGDAWDDSWRDDCEDGFEYGVYPEEYDTEEEYEEALEDAKFLAGEDGDEFDGDAFECPLGAEGDSWRDDCENGSEYGLDPGDFDTEEKYEEALEEAKFLAGESDSYFCGALPSLPDEAEGDEGQLDSCNGGGPANCEAREAPAPDAAPLPPEGGGRKPEASGRTGTSRGERIARLIAALALAAICLVPIVWTCVRVERMKAAYAQAEVRIRDDDCAGALELLEDVSETYRNAKFLAHYAQARIDYEQGELSDANDELTLCDKSLAPGEAAPEGYEDFRAEVSAARRAREEAQEWEGAGASAEMPEAGIPSATPGTPARSAYSSGDRGSKSKKEDGDPLNARDYLFPEDFYEDNWDDFYDFEEAEDYFYEHGGS